MSRIARRLGFALLPLAAMVGLVLAAPATAATGQFDDYAVGADSQSHNVVPPGNSFFANPAGVDHSSDQLPLYDGLTPLFDNVTQTDVDSLYKPANFGLNPSGRGSAEGPALHPRPGVTIQYDNFGVPHITGNTRDDVMYGAGWAVSKDRNLLLTAFRGAGKIAALDAPGYDTFNLALGLATVNSTPQADDILLQQEKLLQRRGARGRRVLQDIDQFILGINAATPSLNYTRADVLGAAAFIGATFGKGGGNEVGSSQLLKSFQNAYGATDGRKVWDDFSNRRDKDASASIAASEGSFGPRGEGPVVNSPGNALVDPGSVSAAATQAMNAAAKSRKYSSNAVIVGASKSATGHPYMVAGPQTGYFFPEVLYEMDLHGGGIDARGVTFPGVAPYVLLGRGKDYSFSATSAGNDVTDQFVEKLCGDDTHYMYRGNCLAMEHVDVGDLTADPDGPFGPLPSTTTHVEFNQTKHGPVQGYAKVNGERVAITSARATRGREALSALGFAAFNDNTVRNPRDFFRAANNIELTFNWTYIDSKNIAMFSSGRIPKHRHGVDPALPQWGTGQYEWSRYLRLREHPRVINPAKGTITNWNNKPAVNFNSSDDQWTYGPVYRSTLLDSALKATEVGGKQTMASTVAAMNRAATQDLRTTEVLPEIENVLDGTTAPSARAQQMLDLLHDWRTASTRPGSRLDSDNDGKIDFAGAAIMDKAWPKIADAVLGGKLSPTLINQLASFQGRNDQPGSIGSAFQGGWYSWVDKDLRDVKPLAGNPVQQPWNMKYCGQGNVNDCANAIWQAIDQAGNELETQYGSADPTTWLGDANAERIHFSAFPNSYTMRWTNRPTFQQAMSYPAHRP